MGKLGKKARKFSKKNLQSVLRKNRKLNSKFNKRRTSKKGGKEDSGKEQKKDAVELSNARLLGYEGVEVINPDGGKEDAEEEAQRGRWKQEIEHTFFEEQD